MLIRLPRVSLSTVQSNSATLKSETGSSSPVLEEDSVTWLSNTPQPWVSVYVQLVRFADRIAARYVC